MSSKIYVYQSAIGCDNTFETKKEKLIGKDRVVYASFQYEKLSLFYFICGRLGHSKSFCSIRIRIDSSKISFGWDISLRAAPRRWNVSTSKWLHEVDGLISK